jgi:hypothetical protein
MTKKYFAEVYNLNQGTNSHIHYYKASIKGQNTYSLITKFEHMCWEFQQIFLIFCTIILIISQLFVGISIENLLV